MADATIPDPADRNALPADLVTVVHKARDVVWWIEHAHDDQHPDVATALETLRTACVDGIEAILTAAP